MPLFRRFLPKMRWKECLWESRTAISPQPATVAMLSGANQYYDVWLKRQGCPELRCHPEAPTETGAINLMDGCWNVVECNYIYNAPCGIAMRGGGSL